MENIAAGKTKEVYMIWMYPCADLSLVVRAEINRRFEITRHHREFTQCERENTGFRVGWSRG